MQQLGTEKMRYTSIQTSAAPASIRSCVKSSTGFTLAGSLMAAAAGVAMATALQKSTMDDACGGSGVRTIVSATSKYAGLSTAIS